MRLSLRAPVPMKLQEALAPGVAVAFISSPELNGTYSCSATAIDALRIVANDAGSGNGLPFNADFYSYMDIDGNQHAFTADEIRALYRALRDYVIELGYFTSGEVTTAPATPVTIS